MLDESWIQKWNEVMTSFEEMKTQTRGHKKNATHFAIGFATSFRTGLKKRKNVKWYSRVD